MNVDSIDTILFKRKNTTNRLFYPTTQENTHVVQDSLFESVTACIYVVMNQIILVLTNKSNILTSI